MSEVPMNEVQRALEAAFQALDVIPVSGAGVELMATARASLRLAYKLAGEEERQEPKTAQCAADTAQPAREIA